MIPLTRKDHQNVLENQGYAKTFNLPGNWSCQFAALCHILRRFGMYRTPESLRKEIVTYLEKSQLDNQGKNSTT